ncbi:hypothetical protein O181_017147 [Austropuccinia psidii MF-1]|uniref:Uncharacterized protein n=1 Tax=Austropuccinia psidii MF-1 TaxID=1389203 RepID=A0A9Q3GSB6_9BASI|nr:hypothetical protein [Austropuccinia psidii MF-1]
MPSTLDSASTNLPTFIYSPSRYPMSPEPDSFFDHHCHWNITGNVLDQRKMDTKVVTSLFEEVDSLTEVFVDKAIKSAVPCEATRALSREEVAYGNSLVVKFREALKKS